MYLLSLSTRWSADKEWEVCGQNSDFQWMQMAEPVMKQYTEATDGSYIETKESALVWHHRDADLGFGSCQAKEMLDHLESVLANEPVAVKSGQFIVEVKPQVCHLLTFSFVTSFSNEHYSTSPVTPFIRCICFNFQYIYLVIHLDMLYSLFFVRYAIY